MLTDRIVSFFSLKKEKKPLFFQPSQLVLATTSLIFPFNFTFRTLFNTKSIYSIPIRPIYGRADPA